MNNSLMTDRPMCKETLNFRNLRKCGALLIHYKKVLTPWKQNKEMRGASNLCTPHFFAVKCFDVTLSFFCQYQNIFKVRKENPGFTSLTLF